MCCSEIGMMIGAAASGRRIKKAWRIGEVGSFRACCSVPSVWFVLMRQGAAFGWASTLRYFLPQGIRCST